MVSGQRLQEVTSAGDRTTHSERPSTNTPLLRSSRITRFCLSGFSSSLARGGRTLMTTCKQQSNLQFSQLKDRDKIRCQDHNNRIVTH
ncbi:MAG: hypothetical protein FRX49_04328 [Trebouxia sp. A1-2]|nr:MAG: hypothetical protein FRX49_04328 [Trebouxia sp. A1-2]